MDSEGTVEDLVEVLKNDPDKLAMVLQILSQNKEVDDMSSKRNVEPFESPTALMRRRQLEKHIGPKKSSKKSFENSLEPSFVPFNELLKGVVAFVEVRGKGSDRSAGAKALMRSMGAEVLDTFTSKVTHVIFKEGTFNTYQKAKLLNIHLVSVLWLEAIKNSRTRLPEKNYPALGINALHADMSLVCDDMQRSYDDVIEESQSSQIAVKKCAISRTVSGNDNNDDIVDGSQEHIGKTVEHPEYLQGKYGMLEGSDSSDSDIAYVDGEPIKSSLSTLNQSKFNSDINNDGTQLLAENENLLNKQNSWNSCSLKNTNTVEMSPLWVTPNKELNWTRKERRQYSSSETNSSETSIESSNQSEEFGRSSKNYKLPAKKRRISSKDEVKIKKIGLIFNRSDESNYKGIKSKEKESIYVDRPVQVAEELKQLDENHMLDCINANRLSKNKSTKKKTKDSSLDKDRPVKVQQKLMDIQKDIATSGESLGFPSKNKEKKQITQHSTDLDDRNLFECIPSNKEHADLPNGEKELSFEPINISRSCKNVLTDKFDSRTLVVRVQRNNYMNEASKENISKDLCEQNNLPKKRKTKKLFNARDSIDSSLLVSLDLIRNEKNSKLTPVRLAPALLSKSAAKLVEKYHSKRSSCGKDNIPKKTVEKKLPNTREQKQSEIMKDVEVPSRQKSQNLVGGSKEKLKYSTRDTDKNSSIKKTTEHSIIQRTVQELNVGCNNEKPKSVRVKLQKKGGIACTKLHRYEVEEFENIVEKLGDFVVEYNVTSKTTHLVAGECKRTINLLRALARGLWILKLEWLYDSYKEGKWLPEDHYELVEYSPFIQKCRIERQRFGPAFKMSIFDDLGPIYVSRGTDPKASDLKELIKLGQGHVTQVKENASICIGEIVKDRSVICVNSLWVLDSINEYCRKPFHNYLMKKQESPSF